MYVYVRVVYVSSHMYVSQYVKSIESPAGSPAYAAYTSDADIPARTTGAASGANSTNADTTAESGERRNIRNDICSRQCIGCGRAASNGTC